MIVPAITPGLAARSGGSATSERQRTRRKPTNSNHAVLIKAEAEKAAGLDFVREARLQHDLFAVNRLR
jgi:hypothetical protein